MKQPNQPYIPIPREDYWMLFTPPSTNRSRTVNTGNAGDSIDRTQTIRQHKHNNNQWLSSGSSFNSSLFSQRLFLSPEYPTPTPRPSSIKVKRKRLRKQIIEEHQCSICLQIISNRADLPCGHSYCHECLLQWFSNSTRCPYCRTEVTSYTFNGQQHKVEPKEFEYQASLAEQLDWTCYRCPHTREGDVLMICDNCGAFACHIECDELLGGVEPEGEWICHYCR